MIYCFLLTENFKYSEILSAYLKISNIHAQGIKKIYKNNQQYKYTSKELFNYVYMWGAWVA